MSNLVGPDVSFWQDDDSTPRGVDFVAMAKRTRFVIIRAGQNEWVDPDFRANWKAAKDAGLARGSYWFWDSRSTPEKQADLWFDLIKDDRGEIPHFGDFEESYGGPYGGWENFLKFMEHMGRTEDQLGVYTRKSYFDEHVPAENRALFEGYVLWIAHYTNASAPAVPFPWGADEWLLWQYTDNGPGAQYGAESTRIDLNYFNERFLDLLPEAPPLPETDRQTFPYPGVMYNRVERFGTTCHIFTILQKYGRFEVTDHFGRVSRIAELMGAHIVTNGDGWGLPGVTSGKPNSIAYSNGRPVQTVQRDFRPWINFSAEQEPSINWQNPFNLFNAVSGDRYVVENGAFNRQISDRNTKNARTAIGLGATEDEIVWLVADGWDVHPSLPPSGLTFPELAAVMIEFGAHMAINLDGGGSTAGALAGDLVNEPNDDGVPGERTVVNHLLYYSFNPGPDPDPDPPPEPGGKMYRVVTPIRPRPNPSLFSRSTRFNLDRGFEFEAQATQDTNDVIDQEIQTNTWVQLPDGFWVPLTASGETYVINLAGENPPPDPDPVEFEPEITITIRGISRVYRLAP